MSNSYRLEREDIMDALADIEKFAARMDVFIEKYPSYSYSIDISEDNVNAPDKWIVQVTIEKDEYKNSKDI